MMNHTDDILRNNIFMLQDKINMAEMLIAHARANLDELQNILMDIEDRKMEEKYYALR
jgi:hypothetical protein